MWENFLFNFMRCFYLTNTFCICGGILFLSHLSNAQYVFIEDTARKCFILSSLPSNKRDNKNKVKGSFIISNKIICMDTTISFSSSITFQNSEFKMAPNVSITILPGGNLNINNCHFYACSAMWGGITALNNTTLSITNSLIEDALVAVDAVGNGTNTSTTNFRIFNTTFNRNYIGIFLHDYRLPATTYPFFVGNCVFTCRDIPFVPNSLAWPSTAAVSATVLPTTPLQSPYINNALYSPTNTAAFLKAPFLGQKSFNGIKLKNVGKTTGTFAPGGFTYYEFVLGNATSQNIFDNLVYGIDAFNTNFTSYNNVYQYMVQTGKGGTGGSIGINARADNGIIGNLNFNRIRVMPSNTIIPISNNKFYDCSTAMLIENYTDMQLLFNDIRSTQVNTAPAVIINHPGTNGISCKTGKFLNANIVSNRIFNIENGISFIASVVTSTNTAIPSQQVNGQLTITSNTIQAHLSGFPITTQYVSNAIYATSILLATPQYSTVGTTSVTINNNRISNVWRGIYVANWYQKNIQVQSNCIGLSNDSYGAVQFGIQSANNIPVSTLGVQIYNNSVTGPASPSTKMKGIWVSLATQQMVRCNTVNSLENGIEYSGTTAPCQFMGNTLQNCKKGYVLSNNAIIGAQGTIGQPSDNRWVGSWTGISNCLGGNWKTFLDNSTCTLSPLYVRNISSYNPNNSSCAIGTPPIPYDISNGSIILTNGPMVICPPLSPCSSITPPSPLVFMPPSPPVDIPVLEKIAQNLIPAFIDSASSRFISQNHLFRTLLSVPSLSNASPILQQFVQSNQLSFTNAEKFRQAESDITNANYSAAQSKISSASPQSISETNHKQFYQIYLNYLQTGTISSSDSAVLFNIASACPYKDGAVVYQARAFYNALQNTIIVFEDNCYNGEGGKFINNSWVSEEKKESIEVFPNPNKGSFIISSSTSSNATLYIEINDVSGKSLYSSVQELKEGKLEMQLNLLPGVYFIKLTNAQNGTSFIKKLIVQ